MVSGDGGQLYTIEGVAAGLIMIMTAYLVINATSVYTAGDTHINDMQLEVLGSDALKMMDTPKNTTMNSVDNSPLRMIIESNDGGKFNATFFPLINNRTLQEPDRFIQYTANYTYRDPGTNSMNTIFLNSSRNLTGGEHTVRVTKWVTVYKELPDDHDGIDESKDRAVLAEVLMWRD